MFEVSHGLMDLDMSFSYTVDNIDRVDEEAIKFLVRMGIVAEEFGIRLAVREGLLNAINHGCCGDPNKIIKCDMRLKDNSIFIEIDDGGKTNIFSSSVESVEKAIEMIRNITQEAEVNKIYHGTVKRIMDFGAFVEIFPGTDGLVHISQLAEGRVQNVRDILKEGDKVMVKVLEIDKQGKIKLSRKEALNQSPS